MSYQTRSGTLQPPHNLPRQPAGSHESLGSDQLWGHWAKRTYYQNPSPACILS